MFDNSFLADRIYLKGSLKNLENAFEFTLRNRIDNCTFSGLKSLSVDGFNIPTTSISLRTSAGILPAAEVNFNNPLPVSVGQDTSIVVSGNPLTSGQHSFVLTVNIMEIGRATLKFSDMIG